MARRKANDWLKASEIGHYAWSAEDWLDRRLGVEPDADILKKMEAGERYHRQVALRTDWARMKMGLAVVGIIVVLGYLFLRE